MFKSLRYSASIIALVLVLLFCVSCNDTDAPVTDSGTTDTTVNTEIKIVENGASNYTIIRAEGVAQDSKWVSAAIKIAEAIKTATGVMPTISTDWLKPGTTHDSSTKAILVGHTNFSESIQINETLKYGDCAISIVGNKIVVAAPGEDQIEDITQVFTKAILSAGSQNELTLKAEDLTVTKTLSERLSALPIYEGGTLSSVFDAGEKNDLIVVTKTNPEDYNKYLRKLESDGFTCYTTHQIANNEFATYTNDHYTVTVGYYAYESSTRIVIEPLAPKVPLASDDTDPKICTPQITLIGVEEGDAYQNGLSILIRLENGQFIVIDGGFNLTANAESLINQMKAQAPDPQNIEMAAWVITHPHGDHVRVLINQYPLFIKAGIKVEKFIWNIASNKALAEAGLTSEGLAYYDMVSAAKSFAGSEIIRAHVGQVFHLGGAQLEVLYTVESYFPKVINTGNTTSIVINCIIADQKFMILGDATGHALSICAQMYGDYLKADIVQLSHHGYNTGGNDAGTISAYQLMHPELVLFPVGSKGYLETVDRPYNQALLGSPNVKEIIVAGSDDHVIPLPYVYKGTKNKAA